MIGVKYEINRSTIVDETIALKMTLESLFMRPMRAWAMVLYACRPVFRISQMTWSFAKPKTETLMHEKP